MSDASELTNVAESITSNATGPSDTIASRDDGNETKRKRTTSRKSRVSIDPEIETETQSNVSYQQMGQVMAASFFSLCTVIGGPDWKPDSGEADALSNAFAGYFESKGIEQLSPELLLGLVIVGYGGKRIMLPSTQSRFRTIWERIKNARTNRGNNHQWQNNTGTQTGDNTTEQG